MTATRPGRGEESPPPRHAGGGWRVGQSLAMELDVALGIMALRAPPSGLPRDLMELADAAPSEWLADGKPFLDALSGLPELLVLMADYTGVLDATDYEVATLPMRQLTSEEALRAARRAGADAEAPDATGATGLAPGEPSGPRSSPAAAAELTAAIVAAVRRVVLRHGFDATTAAQMAQRGSAVARLLPRLLSDGDLGARFWMWMDRFYFTVYAPWRAEQDAVVSRELKEATTALGAAEGRGVPALDWVSTQSPLKRIPQIAQEVAEGQVEVVFWAQPFGLFDFVHLRQDQIAVSYSAPGAVMALFEQQSADLADRLKALADPTRLKILRLIRNFEVDNTDIADYLELARPTVSIHAKQLREAGLISSRREGRSVVHSLRVEAVRGLQEELRRFLDVPEMEPDDAATRYNEGESDRKGGNP